MRIDTLNSYSVPAQSALGSASRGFDLRLAAWRSPNIVPLIINDGCFPAALTPGMV